ncbi:unnamed protein product [Rotaria sp. Silwood2]|nr:unnamed protein product [Rotaria sp. Silwood2]CAF4555641.1 unnamed protein product [Rotaria sp. Silwood2]
MDTELILWDADELKKNIKSTQYPFTDYQLVTEDTCTAKTHALGIEAELKLGVLNGLVSVSGAAKYVDDQKTSGTQARVTGKFIMLTQYDELTMSHLAEKKIKYTDVLNHPEISATHVVTGIQYGADAFFIFDRTVSSDENHKDVLGELKISVEKIPKLTVNAGGKFNFNENNKETSDKLSCKFYGDFEIDSIPTTFDNAVKLYCELPKRIKNSDGICGVPKKVWLHPLKAFSQYKIAKIVHNISSCLIDLSVNRIEKLQELETKANDLKNQFSTLMDEFSSIKIQLDHFTARLLEFERKYKEDIRILLPKIRGGEEESLALDRLSQKIDISPFNTQKLESWLASKEKELVVLQTCVSTLKEENISIVSIPIQSIISDIRYDFLCNLCFHFTELNEPQISQMFDYLYSQSEINSLSTTYATTDKVWYQSPDIINKIRYELCQFIGFAKVNKTKPNIHFFVNESYADDYNHEKGASVMLYKHGMLDVSFQIPSQPGIPHPIVVTSNSITLEWSRPIHGYKNVTKYKISYYIHQNEQDTKRINNWNEIVTDSMVESKIISNLSENTIYVFKVQAVTIAGESVASDISCPIETPRLPREKTASSLDSNVKIRKKIQRNGYPDIHEVGYQQEIINQNLLLRKCFIGERTLLNGYHPPEKIIMIVGATGAGKSTMINAIVNFYYGIRWKDDFRLKLITEEDEGINGIAQSQVKSQTKFITAYTLYYQVGCPVQGGK